MPTKFRYADWLFDAIVVTALGMVAFVVIIGGIICIHDDRYSFNEYTVDLQSTYKLLTTALIAAIAHAWLGRMNGNHKEEKDDPR